MRIWTIAFGIACSALAFAPVAGAETDAERARQDRIEELERKVDVLTDELSKLREERGVPADDELESRGGLGPAASRIYGITKGLSLGGYAEGFYRGFVGDDTENDVDRADLLRLVLYAGYKFTDRLVFNSEIEFEHATTSAGVEALDGESGEVSVELAALDYLWRDEINLRGGLVLMPIGFLNEVHEPPFFHGVSRPVVENRLIPTTWREIGGGVYGEIGDSISYRAYAVTGLDAQGLRTSSMRSARGQGNRQRAEDGAGVVRVDWTPIEGGLLGGSFYFGGLDQERAGFGDGTLAMWDLHAQYRWKGLELRALYTQALIDGAEEITEALQDDGVLRANQAIAKNWLGGYLEAAFDVMPWIFPNTNLYLAPFMRVEWLDTQFRVPSGFEPDEGQETWVFTPGITFKPHPNVALKLDYRNFERASGEQADEVEVGFGVAF
jgi:hypothetical protein